MSYQGMDLSLKQIISIINNIKVNNNHEVINFFFVFLRYFCSMFFKRTFYTNQTFFRIIAEGYNFVGFTDFQDSIRLFIIKN